jgi:hypothetical protein
MKPVRAIALLTVPLAVTWVVLLGAMCLTPYWTCKADWSIPLTDAWRPILFIAAVLLVVAAAVLTVDLWVVKLLPQNGYGLIGLAVAGAAIATLPRILWDLPEAAITEAFAPQVEFLPFTLAGAIFIVVLARLVGRKT